jgi:hypothetical protein
MRLSIRTRCDCWLLSLAATLAVAQRAEAQSCTASSFSSCVPADAVWPSETRSHFLWLDSARAERPAHATLGLSLQYLNRPIVLTAASPDPYGTEITAVRYVLDATLTAAVGVLPNLEATAALPMVLSQAGNGVSSLTSLRAEPIASTTVSDPRLGLGFDWLDQPAGGGRITGKLDYRLSLPLGNEAAFAGERGLVNAPSLIFAAHFAPLLVAAQIGARLRPAVQLGDARHGHQLSFALGTSAALLERELLDVSVEAWALPSLESQVQTTASGSSVDSSQIPAEWLLSLRSRPLSALMLHAGVGTAIPISSSSRALASGEHSEDSFAALPSARWRLSLAARWLLDPEP